MSELPSRDGLSLPWPETACGEDRVEAETFAVERVRSDYERHSRLLYRLALAECRNGELARDAVQEAFLRYFEACSKGQAIHSVRSWLARVVINFLRDDARRMARLAGISEASGAVTGQTAAEPAGDLERQIGSMLSPRERECIELRVLGYKYQEIAEILGLRPGSVACLLSRALRKLETLRGGKA